MHEVVVHAVRVVTRTKERQQDAVGPLQEEADTHQDPGQPDLLRVAESLPPGEKEGRGGGGHREREGRVRMAEAPHARRVDGRFLVDFGLGGGAMMPRNS